MSFINLAVTFLARVRIGFIITFTSVQLSKLVNPPEYYTSFPRKYPRFQGGKNPEEELFGLVRCELRP
jgi:hypothetical protein